MCILLINCKKISAILDYPKTLVLILPFLLIRLIRAELISDFIKSIYGPERGIKETVTDNPLKKYITGILSPEITAFRRDPDQDSELIVEETKDNENIPDITDSIPDYIQTSPSLNAKNKPRSFGISFNVTSDENPIIKLCLTWGKYYSKKNEWTRDSRGYISEDIICSSNKKNIFILDKNGKPCQNESAEVAVQIITWRYPKNLFFISIFFTNVIKVTGRDYAVSEEYIFQPQIRINLLNGKLSSINRNLIKSTDEIELDFLYGDDFVPARGHMCSVLWNQVDPEREFNGKIDKNPFSWIDLETVKNNPLHKDFINPHLRTEFLPTINIESPIYEWSNLSNLPELHPKKLSEIWDPEELRSSLNPFVIEFEKWINDINLEQYEETEQKIISKLQNDNKQILKRIKNGIELLVKDEDVRLAFCFTNKVISLQNEWKGADFPWRPFQLAFILNTLESVANKKSNDRDICDLLVVPTGAGKTEAYLGIAAFSMAYRRLKSRKNKQNEDGCEVLMRYTLRLLTIQQYRRALQMVTACEYLRVLGISNNEPIGWRPLKYEIKDDFIWGFSQFSIGLWVGGNVSPNRLSTIETIIGPVNGAIDILINEEYKGEGEPAQILECPVCGSVLSVPKSGLKTDKKEFYLIFKIEGDYKKNLTNVFSKNFGERLKVLDYKITSHNNGFYTLKIEVKSDINIITSLDIDNLEKKIVEEGYKQNIKMSLIPVRASRPGYFLKYITNERRATRPYNFEIYCPKPDCSLHNENGIWVAATPLSENHIKEIQIGSKKITLKGKEFVSPSQFNKYGNLSKKIPIPALTVDEQVYNYCPSFIIATVDKIARLPFEPRAASMFGNVNYYDSQWGYYREGIPTLSYRGNSDHPTPDKTARKRIDSLEPPNLVIQDELHLIEGPLGSMVGIYETLVEFLASKNYPLKYIASTATVKGASGQVSSLFSRQLSNFPTPIKNIKDKFYIKFKSDIHQLAEDNSGRLYIGVCSPGWGSLTPVYRIWSRLLQSAFEKTQKYDSNLVDYYWTLVGYFNSIRELAGARTMYRQDIPGNIKELNTSNPREIPDDRIIELSSRRDSTELPSLLTEISQKFTGNIQSPGTPDAIFTTSMFGTGVDITRLSLMIMHGQPKSTSSYIQSTGRVGRKKGGLVVTIYSPAKPRDLNHYEMFCGYHTKMDMFVEPISVTPFAPGTLSRCLGPVIVGALRSKVDPAHPWYLNDTAIDMKDYRNSEEVSSLIELFSEKNSNQSEMRKMAYDDLVTLFKSELDKWQLKAEKAGKMKYYEYTSTMSPVVLGDPEHKHQGLAIVYENAPNSLRDIEETTGFQIKE